MKLIKGSMALLVALSVGCSKKSDSTSTTSATTASETAQQVGDSMASVDEFGGSGGSMTYMESEKRIFARVAGHEALSPIASQASFVSLLVPQAQATSCILANTWGSCTTTGGADKIVRTFGGCTIGGATLDGTVTLTFTDAAVNSTCAMAASGHSITRDPNFTITAANGATYTVSKTGTEGQKVVRGASAGNYTFSNDGIRRVIASGGTTLFDMTTQTTSAITVTGASRSGRVMTGGSLRTTNNLTSVTCDFVPTAVTWVSSCNCPTSGEWAATCSDGKSGEIEITGCGTGTITLGTTSESVTFDRCYGI